MPVTNGLAVNPPQAGGYNARLQTNAQRANAVPVDQGAPVTLTPEEENYLNTAGAGALNPQQQGLSTQPAPPLDVQPVAPPQQAYAREVQDSTGGQAAAEAEAAAAAQAETDAVAQTETAATQAETNAAAAAAAATQEEAAAAGAAAAADVRALFAETMGLSGADVDGQAVDFWVKKLLAGELTIDELRERMIAGDRGQAYEADKTKKIHSNLHNMFMEEEGKAASQESMDFWAEKIRNGEETIYSIRQKVRAGEEGVGYETPTEANIAKWYTEVYGQAPTQEQINDLLVSPKALENLQAEYAGQFYGTEEANAVIDEAYAEVQRILDRVREEGLEALNDANSESGAQLDAALEQLLALVQQSTQASTDAINQGKDEANTAWDQANSDIAAMIAQAIGALQPYNEQGQKANAMLMDFLGANGPEAQAAAFAAYENSPGQQHIIDQGQEALIASAAATGQLGSANTKKALLQFAIGEANKNFDTRMGQLGSVADRGLAAAQGISGASMQGAGLYAGIGEGRARTAETAGLAIADVNQAGMATSAAGVQNLMGQKAQNTITTGSSVRDFLQALGAMEAQAGLSTAGMKAQNIYNTGQELAQVATELGTEVSEQQLAQMEEYDAIITSGMSTLSQIMSGQLTDINATHMATLQELINMDQAYANLVTQVAEAAGTKEDGTAVLDISKLDWTKIGEGIMGLFGGGEGAA